MSTPDVPLRRALTLAALRSRVVDLLHDLDAYAAEQRADGLRRAARARAKRKAAGRCKRCLLPVHKGGLCAGHYGQHLAAKRVGAA